MKKRKQTENGETPGSESASGEDCVWLTIDEAMSHIGDRHMPFDNGECTTFKLEGIKDHERSTLHEHCIKIAQAKKGLSQTDGALLEKWLM